VLTAGLRGHCELADSRVNPHGKWLLTCGLRECGGAGAECVPSLSIWVVMILLGGGFRVSIPSFLGRRRRESSRIPAPKTNPLVRAFHPCGSTREHAGACEFTVPANPPTKRRMTLYA
jgi:hypothetical protein